MFAEDPVLIGQAPWQNLGTCAVLSWNLGAAAAGQVSVPQGLGKESPDLGQLCSHRRF